MTIRERLMHTKSVMILTLAAIAAVLLIGAGAALLLLEGGKQCGWRTSCDAPAAAGEGGRRWYAGYGGKAHLAQAARNQPERGRRSRLLSAR